MPIGTTALILAGLTAAQTATSVIGDRKAAKAAQQSGDLQASDAIARGEEAARHIGSDSRLLEGGQRVAFGASGVDIGTGSAADVISSDQRRALIDEQAARTNASREAFGFMQQGKAAAQGYRNRATGSLLNGASTLYGQYRAAGLNKQRVVDTSTATQGTQGGYYGGKVSP